MKKEISFIFSILSLSTSLTIHAQNTLPLDCANIEAADLRLECYDRWHRQQKGDAAETSKTIDLQQSYQTSIDTKNPQVVLATKTQLLPDEESSHLSRLYDLDNNRQGGILTVREHESIYILPAWYRSSPNHTPYSSTRGYAINDLQQKQKNLEAKMHISLKTKILEDVFASRADVWFGYTQQSNWQVYNQGEKSAPFRNNDYSPEIFITQPVKATLPMGGQLRMLGVGFVHQSNGQDRPLSRSWNRVYAMAGMEWGALSAIPRIWVRVDPNSSTKNDNPDITHYMGHGDLKLRYQINDKHTIASTLRYNIATNKGAIQVDYTFPIKGKLKAYVQGFHGYGENLLDYNHKQTGIGIGIALKEWNGL